MLCLVVLMLLMWSGVVRVCADGDVAVVVAVVFVGGVVGAGVGCR